LSVLGHIRGKGYRVAALPRDHLDRSLGKLELPVHDQNTRARTGKQDGGRSTIANAVSGGASARDDGDLAFEAEAIPRY
jgi:hypothetical protein